MPFMDRPTRSWARRVARSGAAGLLTFAVAASAAGCGSAAQTAQPGNAGATPSPSVEPSSAMPSGTATPVVTPSPSPKATPAVTVKPVAKIINPDPSDKPRQAVTAQEMEAAVAAYATPNPDGDLTPKNIASLNGAAPKCAGSDPSISRLTRLSICQATALDLLNHAKANSDQMAWDAAFSVYWYTVGPNGLGPSVKADFSQYLKKFG